MRIIDGIQGWSGKTFDKTRMKGDSWRIRSQPSDDGLRSDQCILVMWFPKLDRARAWMDSEFSFKQKDFPSPDGFDSFACPLNYIPENGNLIFILCTSYLPRSPLHSVKSCQRRPAVIR